MTHAKYGLLNFCSANSIVKVHKILKSEISEMSFSIDSDLATHLASVKLYYRYFHERCSSKLDILIPVPYSRGTFACY